MVRPIKREGLMTVHTVQTKQENMAKIKSRWLQIKSLSCLGVQHTIHTNGLGMDHGDTT